MRSIDSYEHVIAWELALSVSSMNDCASPPESSLTALAWLLSEKISVIREMRFSLVNARVISCFQAGVSLN